MFPPLKEAAVSRDNCENVAGNTEAIYIQYISVIVEVLYIEAVVKYIVYSIV
jgi:hypothetical protein